MYLYAWPTVLQTASTKQSAKRAWVGWSILSITDNVKSLNSDATAFDCVLFACYFSGNLRQSKTTCRNPIFANFYLLNRGLNRLTLSLVDACNGARHSHSTRKPARFN